jgi:serine/threonine-protein kinase RsbW
MLILNVPAESRYVGTVRACVAALLENLGVVPDDVYDVGLILGEACSNVVRHAYSSSEECYTVRVEFIADGIAIIVTDRGRGVDPERRPCPDPDRTSGWGVWLMERISDHVSLRPVSPRGTEVRAEKKLRYRTLRQDREAVDLVVPPVEPFPIPHYRSQAG